jgi:hypothetical protein
MFSFIPLQNVYATNYQNGIIGGGEERAVIIWGGERFNK